MELYVSMSASAGESDWENESELWLILFSNPGLKTHLSLYNCELKILVAMEVDRQRAKGGQSDREAKRDEEKARGGEGGGEKENI